MPKLQSFYLYLKESESAEEFDEFYSDDTDYSGIELEADADREQEELEREHGWQEYQEDLGKREYRERDEFDEDPFERDFN
jgi:hypothetical protein